MTRARAIVAVLLSALFFQLAVAVPAFAVAKILAARCCNADCPARPSTAAPDRCCAIGTAPAAERALPSAAPADSGSVALVSTSLPTAPVIRLASSAVAPPSTARAAPLFLIQRSLQL